MKFSIITPVLNRRKDIENMLNSVNSQNFSDFELLIVDNGSVDGTYEYCKSIEKQFNYIKVLKCEQKGLAFARNTGIKKALGEWIILLDSDNKFIDEKILEKVNILIDTKINDNILGIWTKSISTFGKECSFVESEFLNRSVNFENYLKYVSGEFAPIVRTLWFQKNLYPEIIGAITEFPNMAWFQLLRDGDIYVSELCTQIYGTDNDGRICSLTVSKQRAFELSHYYKMIVSKFYDELVKFDQLNEYVLKLYAYNAISNEFKIGYFEYFKYLSLKNRIFIFMFFVLPKNLIRFIIEKYKENHELK